MKELIKIGVFTFIGILIGCSIMALLAKRASSTYADILKINYEQGEELAALEALKSKQYFLAVHHFKNLADSSSFPATQAIKGGDEIWGPMFPFAAEVLKKVKESADPKGLGASKSNGINHGMLAYAFEKYGMHDEAEREWKKTMAMLGINDINHAKKLIEKIIKMST